jgi:hypothetical protein
MTPTTKDTRRDSWKGWNFAGTIDWALDLQSFTADDMALPDRPQSGQGCVYGVDDGVNSGDLCDFARTYGFCPDSLCTCIDTDDLPPLPSEVPVNGSAIAWDEFDVDLNRLCVFACKYNYCPGDICTIIPNDNSTDDDLTGTIDDPNDPNYFNYSLANLDNYSKCPIYNDPTMHDESVAPCHIVCQPELDQAKQNGRTSNYGCVGSWPLNEPIPWETYPTMSYKIAPGVCMCGNWIMNEIADDVINALPIIAEVCLRGNLI